MWPCHLDGRAPLTIRVFTTLQSDSRDMWPLRQFIRVTNQKTKTKTKTKTVWFHKYWGWKEPSEHPLTWGGVQIRLFQIFLNLLCAAGELWNWCQTPSCLQPIINVQQVPKKTCKRVFYFSCLFLSELFKRENVKKHCIACWVTCELWHSSTNLYFATTKLLSFLLLGV